MKASGRNCFVGLAVVLHSALNGKEELESFECAVSFVTHADNYCSKHGMVNSFKIHRYHLSPSWSHVLSKSEQTQSKRLKHKSITLQQMTTITIMDNTKLGWVYEVEGRVE